MSSWSGKTAAENTIVLKQRDLEESFENCWGSETHGSFENY